MPYHALIVSLLKHYVFSFQRFTLQIARKHAVVPADTTTIQILMSPAILGAAGWLSALLLIGAAILVGFAFVWWVGVAYLLVDLVLFGALAPLLPFKSHFAAIAQRELQNHMNGPNACLASSLTIDVIRLGAGHTT